MADLNATVNVPFTADAQGEYVGSLPSGLVGSITVGVYTAPSPGGIQVVAPTPAGIIELAGPVYQATLTVPAPVTDGVVRWVIPATSNPPVAQQIAEEELVVTVAPPVGSSGYIIASDMGAGDGIVRDAYEPGNLIRLTARVFEFGGTMIDPDTLTLTVQAPALDPLEPLPDPVVLTQGQLNRTTLGVWEYVDFALTPGQWLYRWATTGPLADTGSQSFWILAP